MRNCGLWITPFIDEETIIDTSTITFEEWKSITHDEYEPPKDTLLVLMHPKRHQMFVNIPDQLGSIYHLSDIEIAKYIIEKNCRFNPVLRKIWRW